MADQLLVMGVPGGAVIERHGVGQHRNALAALRQAGENLLVDARALAAEHQIVAVAIRCLRVHAARALGEQVKPFGMRLKLGVASDEVVPVLIFAYVEVVPVVHAGAFEGGVGEVETVGLDEMQPRPRHHAGSPDVAGVGGNLGLEKHDVEHGVLSVASTGTALQTAAR